jgi:glyoxylase-like metal-dependent hydrolase (beta-lactamase superfamily II)
VLTGERGPRLMPRVLNEDNEQCRESLRALEPLAAEVVLPGHGEPFRGGPAEAVAQALAEPARG